MHWFRHHWLVFGVLLFTLLMRVPLLNGSFWLDEAAQILESSRPLSQQLQIKDDFQPPLLHIVTYLTHLASTSEWWLRLWGAVIPSLLTTWVMLELVKEWWPSATAARSKQLWLGLLLATNSLWVFYSQELRPYSLAVLWCCLSWWMVVRLTRSSKPQTNWWLSWILGSIAGLYSTYLYPFVLLSQGFYFVSTAMKQPRLWKPLLLSGMGVAAGFAPWVPGFLEQLGAGQQLRHDLPGWDQVVSTTQLKALPLAFGKFLYGVVNLELDWRYGLVTLLVVGLTGWLKLKVWQHWPRLSPETKNALFIFAWWIIVPVVLAWLVSFKIPVIQPKRILFVLPALYGFLVVLGTELQQRFKLQAGSVLLCTLLIINIWSLLQYWTNPFYQRENWRSVHQQLMHKYPSHETIAVFSFSGPFAGWQWYDQRQTASLSLGYLSKPGVTDVAGQLKDLRESHLYVLVFEYLEELTDPRREVKNTLKDLGWKEIDAVGAPGVGFVRVYAKPENLLGLHQRIFTN